jgi:hypothetical protein
MKFRFSPTNVRDQIAFFANAADLRRPAFAVINGLQMTDCKPGQQILGCALALIAMCESANLPLNDVLTKAARALHDAEGPFSTHVRSIRDYAANEIARGHQ